MPKTIKVKDCASMECGYYKYFYDNEDIKDKILKVIDDARKTSGFCGIGAWTGSDDIDLMLECLDKIEEKIKELAI